MNALSKTLGGNNKESDGGANDAPDDPYSNEGGLGNTMEGFGKSKKAFNAAEMFGVAPVEEGKEEDDQEPKKSEVKTDNDNRYS